MFSATMPAEIEQLAAGILHDPAFVKVDPVSSTVDRIQQSLYYVEKGNKSSCCRGSSKFAATGGQCAGVQPHQARRG